MKTPVTVTGVVAIQPFQPAGKGPYRWMNLSDFTVLVEMGNTLLRITIPAGFISDLATIPKIAQWAFFLNPYEPQIVLAALVHDYLSPTKWEKYDAANPFGSRPMYPPTISAGVFYELMKSDEVSMLRRRVYYYAVVAAIDKELW